MPTKKTDPLKLRTSAPGRGAGLAYTKEELNFLLFHAAPNPTGYSIHNCIAFGVHGAMCSEGYRGAAIRQLYSDREEDLIPEVCISHGDVKELVKLCTKGAYARILCTSAGIDVQITEFGGSRVVTSVSYDDVGVEIPSYHRLLGEVSALTDQPARIDARHLRGVMLLQRAALSDAVLCTNVGVGSRWVHYSAHCVQKYRSYVSVIPTK